jgi:hypothetical protein
MKNQILAGLKKRLNGLHGQAGIGLVDALVSVAILGTAVTFFVTDLSSGSIAVQTHSEAVTAQQLAQTQIENIKAAPYDDATGASYPPIDAPDGYSVSIVTGPTPDHDANIKKISVTVSHEGEPVLTLEDYKVKQ